MPQETDCGVNIVNAGIEDLPAIAELFTQAFKESVLHHCGKLPRPLAMQDVFLLVYQAEPKAAFVARCPSDGSVVGYCFAPARLSNLWLRAVLGGHIFKWAWRWLTGQYGFGLHPVKVIAANKAAFLRSSFEPKRQADARILSIAVDEKCRGRGIAGRLMEQSLLYFKHRRVSLVRLEVRPDNIPAVRVYKKLGFEEAGYTRDSQGDWLIMLKEMEKDLCLNKT